jgi:hypothetical protein
VPYGGHLTESGRNAIFFHDVYQFWIKDVEILDADSGILSEGRSAFGTITNIRLANDRREGAVTGHHGISLEGPSDVLVSHFRLETRFRHDLTVDDLSNGNVFAAGSAVDLAIDHHTGAPYENLFTNIDAGLGTRLWASGGPITGRGPHSGVRETIWNVRTRATSITTPPYPQLTIVTSDYPGLPGRDDQWIETRPSTILLPQDLHRSQLDARRTHEHAPPP